MNEEAIKFLLKLDPNSTFEKDRVIDENSGLHPVRHELVSSLVAILETGKDFKDHKSWVAHFIFNGNSVGLYTLTSSLIRRVIAGINPKEALDDMLDVISSDQVNHVHGVGISGIRIDKELDFGDGFKLAPRELLPPNAFRQMIVGLKIDGSEDVYFKTSGPAFCALLFSKKRKFIYRRGESAQHDQGDLQPKFEKKVEALLAATAVFSNGSGKFRAHSFMVDHPALECAGESYASGGADFARDLHGLVVDIKSEDFLPIFNHVEALPSEHYRRLCLSTDFVRSSRTINSSPLVRRAIDLGTALEVLLTPDQGTELSYRLCLRGSIAMGGDLEVRKETFDKLKKFYDLRSSAVHNGKFSKNYDWMKDDEKYYEQILAVDELYREIALSLVMSGRTERDWLEETLTGEL